MLYITDLKNHLSFEKCGGFFVFLFFGGFLVNFPLRQVCETEWKYTPIVNEQM